MQAENLKRGERTCMRWLPEALFIFTPSDWAASDPLVSLAVYSVGPHSEDQGRCVPQLPVASDRMDHVLQSYKYL